MDRIFGKKLNGRARLFSSMALLLILAMFITSCSSAKSNNTVETAVAPGAPPQGMYDYSITYASDADVAVGFGGNGASKEDSKQLEVQFSESVNKEEMPRQPANNVNNNRKLIMNGNVSLETLEFDSSIEAMDKLIEDVGGFAETRTVLGKSNHSRALRAATYVIRVPAENFELVLNNMGNIGTVLESNSQGTDITDQYTDNETRVNTLKVQEKTLLDILEKATKLEDVITLESRLSELRYEIERIENSLRNFDRLVAFSRINIYIQEVDDATETRQVEKNLGERISGAFQYSLFRFRLEVEDFLVSVVESWITLIFFGIIIAIVWIVLARRIKRRKKILRTQQSGIQVEISEVTGKEEDHKNK